MIIIISISLIIGGGFIYGLYDLPQHHFQRLLLVPLCIIPAVIITFLMLPEIIRSIKNKKTETTDFLNITEKFCGVLSYEVAERLHKSFGGDK